MSGGENWRRRLIHKRQGCITYLSKVNNKKWRAFRPSIFYSLKSLSKSENFTRAVISKFSGVTATIFFSRKI